MNPPNDNRKIKETSSLFDIYKTIADNQQVPITIFYSTIDAIGQWIKQQFNYWIAKFWDLVYSNK